MSNVPAPGRSISGLFRPSQYCRTGLTLLLLSIAGSLLAQKPPLSATLTKPNSQTVKFNPKQKIPPLLNLPCKMANGVEDRPFACEFSFDKLEIFGKNGVLLATVTAKNSTFSLPINQAKAVPSASTVTYPAVAHFTRINPPAFPVKNGYLIEQSSGVMAQAGENVITLLTGIAIDSKLYTKKAVAFDLGWLHNTDGEALFSVHIENDVTTNHFMPKKGTTVAMHDKAEATIIVNPKLVKP